MLTTVGLGVYETFSLNDWISYAPLFVARMTMSEVEAEAGATPSISAIPLPASLNVAHSGTPVAVMTIGPSGLTAFRSNHIIIRFLPLYSSNRSGSN
ncbi:hypothetical protein [uncultured Bacteroides sp.]|uniref:hypothetical protein n=1 Tax=uncultured Bacteroides sp. TaxID=162156 RepID=UPI00262B7A47|nr:hypothetical protein [uncultured Bacteroides sp.]